MTSQVVQGKRPLRTRRYVLGGQRVKLVFLGCIVTQLKNNSKTLKCLKSRNHNVIGDK